MFSVAMRPICATTEGDGQHFGTDGLDFGTKNQHFGTDGQNYGMDGQYFGITCISTRVFVEAYQKLILSEVECLFEDGFGQTRRAQSNAQGRVRHRPASSAVPPIMATEQTVEDLSLFLSRPQLVLPSKLTPKTKAKNLTPALSTTGTA